MSSVEAAHDLSSHPAREIVMILGLFLMAIAAPSHIRARNTGTLLYIGWVGAANLIMTINGFIWHDNFKNIAPLWCDISSKLQIGMNVGLGASTLVINRRLYKISRINTVIITKAQKRRDLAIDLAIGIGLPVLVMAMHVVVQGHRANIVQGLGCWATTYNVALAYPLVFMWPTVTQLIAIVYGMLSLRSFLQRRDAVEEFLNSATSGISVNRYFRLMCFSATELVVAFPLGLYILFNQVYNQVLFPWISWEDTHYMFDRFDLIPALFITTNPPLLTMFRITVWSVPLCAYIFFIFFGLGREQRSQYKRWFYWCLSPLGIKPPQPKPYIPGADRRTWWQKLLRRPATNSMSMIGATGLTSSNGGGVFGATDSLPAFRNPHEREKPIPSARSRGKVSSDIDEDSLFDEKLRQHHQSDQFDPNRNKRTSTSGAARGTHDARVLRDVDVELELDMNKTLPASPGRSARSPTLVSGQSDADSSDDEERRARRARYLSVVSRETAPPSVQRDGRSSSRESRSSAGTSSSVESVAGTSMRASMAIAGLDGGLLPPSDSSSSPSGHLAIPAPPAASRPSRNREPRDVRTAKNESMV